MAERKDCCYRDTHDPTNAWDSLPERPLGQAEEVAAKYGLLHKRTERDSDPGFLPFEWRAFVEGLEQQRDRKTADCTETQSLRILPCAGPVPMKELEPHRIQAAATCPCQPQQSHREYHAGDLKRMNRRREHDPISYLRIASPTPTRCYGSSVLPTFSPDANVAAGNQPRTCNHLLVHQRSADGLAVHLPTVFECQLQTSACLSLGQLIDDLLQFSLSEANVSLEEVFRNLQRIVDDQRGSTVSLHSDVAL